MMSKIQRVLLILYISSISAKIIDPKMYIDKVIGRMVDIMEQKYLMDKMLPLNNVKSEINVTHYGVTLLGYVTFHDGFVSSIDSASIPERDTMDGIKDVDRRKGTWQMNTTLLLNDVRIVYDLHYVLRDKTSGDATFLMTYKNICFDICIKGNNTDKKVSATMKQSGLNMGGSSIESFGTEIVAYPRIKNVQIITREFKDVKKAFRVPVEKNFEQWAIIFKPALDAAIKEVEYPDIDYFRA